MAATHSVTMGNTLDVMAPGAGFYTADLVTEAMALAAYASDIAGTSLATPVVSGQLAVLKSHMPAASPTELVAALTENTDRTGISSAQPRSNIVGFGRVKVKQSIDQASKCLHATN
jgi:subtilisin family serine protease